MANRNDADEKSTALRPETDEITRSGGAQHAAPDQGGITDLKNQPLTPGQTADTERGSGLTTKGNVTGSDYDGQSA